MRRFRGNTYIIEIKNPYGHQAGVTRLIVDGQEVSGNVLPVQPPRPEPIRVEGILEGSDCRFPRSNRETSELPAKTE
jgi:hypothetical protein